MVLIVLAVSPVYASQVGQGGQAQFLSVQMAEHLTRLRGALRSWLPASGRQTFSRAFVAKQFQALPQIANRQPPLMLRPNARRGSLKRAQPERDFALSPEDEQALTQGRAYQKTAPEKSCGPGMNHIPQDDVL
ncbi:MAG: hypothetical protein ABI698_03250 [bacterium]